MVSEKRASLFNNGLNYRGNLNSCRVFHTLTLATVSQFLLSEKSKFKIKLWRRSNNGCFNFFSRERIKPTGIWLYGAFFFWGARLYACTNQFHRGRRERHTLVAKVKSGQKTRPSFQVFNAVHLLCHGVKLHNLKLETRSKQLWVLSHQISLPVKYCKASQQDVHSIQWLQLNTITRNLTEREGSAELATM